MAVLDFLSADLSTAVLFVLLLISFVVAFKVMQMVFETILVSVLSGAFYIGMVYFLDYGFTFQRVLLFAFLGASLYMTYSFIASAYSIASTVLEIPYHVLRSLAVIPLRWSKKAYTYLRRKYRLYRMQRDNSDDTGVSSSSNSHGDDRDDGDDGDVKEVVLDKVKRN